MGVVWDSGCNVEDATQRRGGLGGVGNLVRRFRNRGGEGEGEGLASSRGLKIIRLWFFVLFYEPDTQN